MISRVSVLFVFSIITFAAHVDSACFQGQVVAQVTKYGTVDTSCIFKDIKVLPGSSFKLGAPDCVECKCTAKSMSCCGFGFAGGKVQPPAGCVAYNDACKLIFVKENNQSEVCKPAKSTSAPKKKSAASRRP